MHLAAAEAFECFFSSYEKQGSEISVKNEDFPTARKKRPQKDEEQNGGRRAFREAIEENARAEESAFYTGQFIGFLYRRSHPAANTRTEVPGDRPRTSGKEAGGPRSD